VTDLKYPNNVYDKPEQLLQVLGSWWSQDYSGVEQLSAVVAALAETQQQTLQDVRELTRSMSLQTIDTKHIDRWHQLRLSQLKQELAVQEYDTGLLYDNGQIYDGSINVDGWKFAKPEELAFSVLVATVGDPSIMWFNQLDFNTDSTSVTFFNNIFEDPRIRKETVYQNGVVVDHVAILWAYRAEVDTSQLYKQYGYAIGNQLRSSDTYKTILQAAQTAMVRGPSGSFLRALLAAIAGVPTPTHDTDKVVQLTSDSGGSLIITEKAAYRLPAVAGVSVAVGDTITKETSLTPAIEVIELNRNADLSSISAISLGKGFLLSCMFGELVFANQNVPLVVDTDDSSGFTKLTWEIGGMPLDVDRFFSDLHDRGIAAATADRGDCSAAELVEWPGTLQSDGTLSESRYFQKGTLAHLLDSRPVSVGEPTTSHLPVTINPVKFLAANILYKHAAVVILRVAGFNQQVTGLQNFRLLRRLLPPQMALLVIVESVMDNDAIELLDAEEELSTWSGTTAQGDEINDTMVSDSGLVARVVL